MCVCVCVCFILVVVLYHGATIVTSYFLSWTGFPYKGDALIRENMVFQYFYSFSQSFKKGSYSVFTKGYNCYVMSSC